MSNTEKYKEALFKLEKDLDHLMTTIDDEKIMSESITVEEVFVRFRKLLFTSAAMNKIMVQMIKEKDQGKS